MGKTALLNYVVERARGCRVALTAGVQSEMELAYAGLHQLLASMLHQVELLPVPQRDALCTAFGISSGAAPDRFLVSLAVLSLLSDVGEEQPLLCLVDDAQWLDRASAQVLSFVARRLEKESVGLVFAARRPSDDLTGLPELAVTGLHDPDAHALLDSVLTAPLDVAVRDRIIAETRGNPLALLELPRGLTPAELAGGFAVPGAAVLSGRIEAEFQRRLDALPAATRLLLLVAAAEPLGDPLLVRRAAGLLGIGDDDATPAAEAGLLEFGPRVLFRHPMVRSVAYRSASLRTRQRVHRALAEATDPENDPDRRAWHRAQAAAGPNEDVAQELERSADRALGRGGLAAAAAFLEHSATLTRDPIRRSQRLLAAARAKRDAGALDAALGLLVTAEAGPVDLLRSTEIQLLRGQIAFDQRRVCDASRLLLDVAIRLEPLSAELARETHLEATRAALWAADLANPGGVRAAANAARSATPGPHPPRALDVRLDAYAVLLTEGPTAAAPFLARALELSLVHDHDIDQIGRSRWLAGSRGSDVIAIESWDAEAWHELAARQVQFARDTGALVVLQFALELLAWNAVVKGELTNAALLIDEDHRIATVTANPPNEGPSLLLAAWQGREAEERELAQAYVWKASSGGLGRWLPFADYASAVLHNGLRRHDDARDAAWRAFDGGQIGFGPFIVPELAEAAARTGDSALIEAALAWLKERTTATPTEWALGVEAGVRALANTGEMADCLYRKSIAHLSHTPIRTGLARAHLLYGEWLRRERRRRDARTQLRIAHDMLGAMGIDAFAERARRELLATGETVRRRTDTRAELTPQEAQIASFARDGLSNTQIGARLFISPRTVQYHLRKVFTKLDISSRNQLNRVLAGDASIIRSK
jgi:DNA-binding CsgD family transcriptional regulator